jgi:predicted DNA-binding WGR domain protein
MPELHALQLLVLRKLAPEQNMARYYVLSIEPTLFDDVALVREWGRIGMRGRRRLDLYADHVQASEALENWLARKMRRNYKVSA